MAWLRRLALSFPGHGWCAGSYRRILPVGGAKAAAQWTVPMIDDVVRPIEPDATGEELLSTTWLRALSIRSDGGRQGNMRGEGLCPFERDESCRWRRAGTTARDNGDGDCNCRADSQRKNRRPSTVSEEDSKKVECRRWDDCPLPESDEERLSAGRFEPGELRRGGRLSPAEISFSSTNSNFGSTRPHPTVSTALGVELSVRLRKNSLPSGVFGRRLFLSEEQVEIYFD